jgi:hypothetical protein
MIETFGSRGETSVSPLRVAVRNAGPDGRAGYAGGLMRRCTWSTAVLTRSSASATKLRAPGTPKIASIRSVCTWALIQRACAYEKTSSDSGERVLENPKALDRGLVQFRAQE